MPSVSNDAQSGEKARKDSFLNKISYSIALSHGAQNATTLYFSALGAGSVFRLVPCIDFAGS